MSLELKDQYDKIYNFCYFKVKNKEIAEDLTQETFLKYFKQTSYLNKGKPLAYLYTIARNTCIDYLRKGDCFSIIGEIETQDHTPSLDMSLTMKTEVAKLSEESQEILLLRFTNDLGILEIADYLEVSRFTVRRKINSILKELKSKLRREDFYE